MDERLRDLLERHSAAVSTVAAWAERSGAARVVLLLDLDGDGTQPLLLDGSPGEPLELAIGDESWYVDLAELQPGPAAVQWPPAAPASSIHVQPQTGELSAPLGAIDALARGARELAAAFGGRTVATVEYATHDPTRPLTFAAREGDPVVVAIGNQHFELPAD